jgi:hypothetical protein
MSSPPQIPLNDDKLIYLDLEFISRKYEEKFGTDPAAKISKQESASAGVRAFFANAGVTTQESRTYSITSRKMLHALWMHLNQNYPGFEEFANYKGTQIAWMQGSLTLGEWRNSEGKEPGYEFYQLNHNSKRTAFLADNNYFAAGFSKIFGASSALKGNISIPVKCLTRIMWHVDDAKNYVACPYVIIENN